MCLKKLNITYTDKMVGVIQDMANSCKNAQYIKMAHNTGKHELC